MEVADFLGERIDPYGGGEVLFTAVVLDPDRDLPWQRVWPSMPMTEWSSSPVGFDAQQQRALGHPVPGEPDPNPSRR